MLQALIGPVASLLDKFIEDKDQKAKLAQHRSLFVAGWRPFLGWCLSFALAWHFIFAPFIIFVCAFAGMEIPDLPYFDMESLMTVLLGMLGLGGLRTFEKKSGLTK